MDGLHINSGSVLINTKRHGQRKQNRDLTGSGSFECSKQSILSSMDKFVRTVQSMRGTILVPSRLRDMRLRPRLPDCQITMLANSAAGYKPHHHHAAGQLAKTKTPLNSSSSTSSSSSHHKLHSHFHTSHHHSLLHNHHPDYHRSQAFHHSSIHSNSNCDPVAGQLTHDPAEIPSALINADLYNFYSMLYDVKQQLLWGPASGQSTIYTNYTANSEQSTARFMMEKSALHQLNSTMANCNLNGSDSVTGPHTLKESRAESTCSSGYSSNSSTRNSTTNLSFIAQCSQTTSIANCSTSSTNSLSPQSTRPPSAAAVETPIEDSSPSQQRTAADQVDACSTQTDATEVLNDTTSPEDANRQDANQEDGGKLSDSVVSSSSSIVDSSSVASSSNKLVDSPQSKTPLSDSDLESELESDSIHRTSEPITDQTQMLASAFRHHLQALHTIMETLTNSADYLTRNWELELGEESS